MGTGSARTLDILLSYFFTRCIPIVFVNRRMYDGDQVYYISVLCYDTMAIVIIDRILIIMNACMLYVLEMPYGNRNGATMSSPRRSSLSLFAERRMDA